MFSPLIVYLVLEPLAVTPTTPGGAGENTTETGSTKLSFIIPNVVLLKTAQYSPERPPTIAPAGTSRNTK
jgi:hypothetical protein